MGCPRNRSQEWIACFGTAICRLLVCLVVYIEMVSAFGRRVHIGFISLLCGLTVFGVAQVRDRIWARYEHEMQDPVEDPPDVGRKGEFTIGRLRYRSPLDGRGFG